MFNDREAWLTEAASLILDVIIMPAFESMGIERDYPKIRVSVGFGKHSRKGKAIAQCFARAASTEGYNEIFVNPEVNDNMTILTALTEAVVMAIDDCQSGRMGLVKALKAKIGYGSPELRRQLVEISEGLKQIPHARLDLDRVHKKDSTRQLKIECEKCGFIARTSAKQARRWLAAKTGCPCCNRELTFPPSVATI